MWREEQSEPFSAHAAKLDQRRKGAAHLFFEVACQEGERRILSCNGDVSCAWSMQVHLPRLAPEAQPGRPVLARQCYVVVSIQQRVQQAAARLGRSAAEVGVRKVEGCELHSGFKLELCVLCY